MRLLTLNARAGEFPYHGSPAGLTKSHICEETHLRWYGRILLAAMLLVYPVGYVFPCPAWSETTPIAIPEDGTDQAPPIQIAEEIATAPFYKRWWFWTAVVAAVAGGVAIAASGGGGGDSPAPTGSVTVTGPAPP
ncbi:hypothetical protein YTPLAS18_17870 [Nitrospira sp.]|nr:hypothetical protein YTPLAS18_17870 [Nitrospira sp.]